MRIGIMYGCVNLIVRMLVGARGRRVRSSWEFSGLGACFNILIAVYRPTQKSYLKPLEVIMGETIKDITKRAQDNAAVAAAFAKTSNRNMMLVAVSICVMNLAATGVVIYIN